MDRRCPDCHCLVPEKTPACECGYRFERKLLRHQVSAFLGPNDLEQASGAVSRSRFLWRATILCFAFLVGCAVLAFSGLLDQVVNGGGHGIAPEYIGTVCSLFLCRLLFLLSLFFCNPHQCINTSALCRV